MKTIWNNHFVEYSSNQCSECIEKLLSKLGNAFLNLRYFNPISSILFFKIRFRILWAFVICLFFFFCLAGSWDLRQVETCFCPLPLYMTWHDPFTCFSNLKPSFVLLCDLLYFIFNTIQCGVCHRVAKKIVCESFLGNILW
jgi:bacterioferritin-associated ferredoxin